MGLTRRRKDRISRKREDKFVLSSVNENQDCTSTKRSERNVGSHRACSKLRKVDRE